MLIDCVDMTNGEKQFVVKRNGNFEIVDKNKIFQRIKNTIDHKPRLDINAGKLTEEVAKILEPNIKTSQLDEATSRICINKSIEHPHFAELALRIVISNHHKNTGGKESLFSNTTKQLYHRIASHGNPWPAINKEYYEFIINNSTNLDKIIHSDRDYRFDYFGFKTLEAKYLLRGDNNIVIERPGEMYLRISIALHMHVCVSDLQTDDKGSIWWTTTPIKDTLFKIKKTYNALSLGLYSHASPTLYNAGTNFEQFASCFLLGIGDSNREIMDAMKEAACISSSSGGVGMHWHDIRCRGAPINKTNGKSSGPLPFMQIANSTMKAFNQGGKRPGSMAIFIEPWHPDIVEIINARKPHIEEGMRAKDLFYAIWIPDLFMHQVESDGDWWLMCPKDCPGLADVYGDEFDKLYMDYVYQKKFKKKVKSHSIWKEILQLSIETGIPYIGFKDHVNHKSNQKNLGTIRSSNLCMEIMEYSSIEQHAVCILSSIAVKNFIIPAELEGATTWKEYCNIVQSKGDITQLYNFNNHIDYVSTMNRIYSEEEFNMVYYTKQMIDHAGLFEIMCMIVQNLNIVIDINVYPNEQTRLSNMLHRPLGIGIQGLSDLFFKMQLPFSSSEASLINKLLFETLYYSALWASSLLAKLKYEDNIVHDIKVYNDPYFEKLYVCSDWSDEDWETTDIFEDTFLPGWYPSFKYNDGCPYSKGIMQYHLWGKSASDLSPRWNWEGMEARVKEHGLRNSQLLACMPTASTSQILGNYECFEPLTSNIYTRKTIAGEHIIVNKYLVDDLFQHELLSPEVIDNIIEHKGSAQYIGEITGDKVNKINLDLYQTAWEMSMKDIINQAADRAIFIDQSQSMNLWMADPTINKLSNMLRYTWHQGLKTGVYYLRSQAATSATIHYKSKTNRDIVPPTEKTDKQSNEKVKKVKKFECNDDICTVCT